MKMAVVIGIFTIVLRSQKKNSGLQRDLNPSPRDIGAMLYQPSYAASDGGSRSILGSYVPCRKIWTSIIYMISFICIIQGINSFYKLHVLKYLTPIFISYVSSTRHIFFPAWSLKMRSKRSWCLRSYYHYYRISLASLRKLSKHLNSKYHSVVLHWRSFVQNITMPVSEGAPPEPLVYRSLEIINPQEQRHQKPKQNLNLGADVEKSISLFSSTNINQSDSIKLL